MITAASISPYTRTLDPSEKRWFAIQVRPRCERLVSRYLQQKEVDAYAPMQQIVRQYTRKRKIVEKPLLSCYVLINICQADYVSVLETENVIGFVRHDKSPALIPQDQIDLLRRVAGSHLEADIVRLDEIEPGDWLEIIGGDLTGLRGRMVAFKGKSYVSMELMQLDSAIILDIDARYLRPFR
jgi:transcriptional antiterminator RfaH